MKLFIGEVVEIKKAFKPFVRHEGDPKEQLPLGTIEIAIGQTQGATAQRKNIYASPASFNRRIPLIGEHVLVMQAPFTTADTDSIKGGKYIYFSPLNVTDDLSVGQLPRTWKIQKIGDVTPFNLGARKADIPSFSPGRVYTFPDPQAGLKKVQNIQPYEGDEIIEGRLGQSIRMGSTVQGDITIYSTPPTWQGGQKGDPIMVFRVKKPKIPRPPARPKSPIEPYTSTNLYTVETLATDDSSIYMTTSQMLPTVLPAAKFNKDSLTSGAWKGAQVFVDSGRVVLNAKKDSVLVLGNKKAVVSGRKVILQSSKYYVDLDKLMDWLKEFSNLYAALSRGTAQLSTAAGPTLIATNLAQVVAHNTTKFAQFKIPL